MQGSTLLTETIAPRKGMPPLLVNLSDRPPERLHYLGVSYGLTQQLYNFWHRCGFEPLYLRQSASETTGENTVIMVRPLEHPDVDGTAWLQPFVSDFKVGVGVHVWRRNPVCAHVSTAWGQATRPPFCHRYRPRTCACHLVHAAHLSVSRGRLTTHAKEED